MSFSASGWCQLLRKREGKELKLGTGQTIIYNNILTNNGNGYDDRTGVFTWPVAGNYMFVVDVFSPGPTSLHLHLNKTKVASLHVSDYQKEGYLHLNRTIVLKVKRKGMASALLTTPIHPGYSITRDIPDFPELRCTDYFCLTHLSLIKSKINCLFVCLSVCLFILLSIQEYFTLVETSM